VNASLELRYETSVGKKALARHYFLSCSDRFIVCSAAAGALMKAGFIHGPSRPSLDDSILLALWCIGYWPEGPSARPSLLPRPNENFTRLWNDNRRFFIVSRQPAGRLQTRREKRLGGYPFIWPIIRGQTPGFGASCPQFVTRRLRRLLEMGLPSRFLSFRKKMPCGTLSSAHFFRQNSDIIRAPMAGVAILVVLGIVAKKIPAIVKIDNHRVPGHKSKAPVHVS